MRSKTQVLFLAPNLIGYFRLCLLALGIGFSGFYPVVSFWLFLWNFLLDGVDGMLARRWNQVSAFGAFLDVIVDNSSRGILWAWSLDGPLSAVPMFLEMLAFLCTHGGSGSEWKTGYFANSPWWIGAVMKNGFKSPAGALAIVGLMGCPLWLWAQRFLPGTAYASPRWALLVVPGRILAGAVEVWVVKRYIQKLLEADTISG